MDMKGRGWPRRPSIENSPFFVGGGFYVIKAMLRAEPRITEAFKNGGGMHLGSMIA
jgi:hypothetical protein